MIRESNIRFPGQFRVHVGLAVSDVEAATQFYTGLLDCEPSKVRPGYAKFEPHDPSVNLSLNQVSATRPSQQANHFGIQVKSPEQLRAVQQRLIAARLSAKVENEVTCCYAVQDKLWVADPDGNRWEIFLVREEAGQREASDKCCEEDCCTDESQTAGYSGVKKGERDDCRAHIIHRTTVG